MTALVSYTEELGRFCSGKLERCLATGRIVNRLCVANVLDRLSRGIGTIYHSGSAVVVSSSARFVGGVVSGSAAPFVCRGVNAEAGRFLVSRFRSASLLR